MQGSREIFPEEVAFGLRADIDSVFPRDVVGLHFEENLQLLQCHSPHPP